MRTNVFFCAAIATLLTACSAKDECTPGTSIACTCPNGAPSAQSCGADRTYGMCLCAGVDDMGTNLDGGNVDGASPTDGNVGDTGTSNDMSTSSDMSTSMDMSVATDMATTTDAGVSSFPDIFSLGTGHTCHVRTSGAVSCWGSNATSELSGSGTGDDPGGRTVSGVMNPVSISAGGGYTCAVLSSGSVKCWGMNASRELGNGGTSTSTSASNVSSISDAVQIDTSQLVDVELLLNEGSHHTCVVRSGGTVSCWGNNTNGELGDGTTTARTSPVGVDGVSGAVQVAVGVAHSCALTEDGAVYCWGNNDDYQLGSTTVSGVGADLVSAVGGATEIGAGARFTCARLDTGSVKCWGNNDYTQVRSDPFTSMPRSVPFSVSGISDAQHISVGADFACAIRTSGAVVCWGRNDRGQLGDGTTSTNDSPQSVDGITDAVAIASGAAHTCALRESGDVYCWGDDQHGQLGRGSVHSSPQTSAVMCTND